MPRWVLLAALLCGCGVPGRPQLTPPPSLTHCDLLRTPTGFELSAPVDLLVRLDHAPIAAELPAQRVQLLPSTLRHLSVAPVVGGRIGHACTRSPTWTPPPPPPEGPIVFPGPAGTVQITWLAPPEALHIVLYRDGAPIARLPSTNPLYTDHPAPGTHHYAIAAEDAQSRTAASAPSPIAVPHPSSPGATQTR
jgi:hypothetical protein